MNAAQDAPDGDTTLVLRSVFLEEADQLVFTYKADGQVKLEPSSYIRDPEVRWRPSSPVAVARWLPVSTRLHDRSDHDSRSDEHVGMCVPANIEAEWR